VCRLCRADVLPAKTAGRVGRARISCANPMSLVGQTVGTFEVEAEICPSRWGTVYRAVQQHVDRTVILKVLSPELSTVPRQPEHFLETMRATARITHAHVVTIYEAGQVNGVHYCAMEYMDGPPLATFLRRDRTVNEHHLLQTIASVARLLDYLWQREILHQPPESHNILVNSTDMVKLINVLPIENPPSRSPHDDILALGFLLAHLVNDISPVSKRVSEIVERMVGAPGREPFASPKDLAMAAADLDHELFPPPTPHARPGAIQPKRTPMVVLAGRLFWLALVITGIVAWWMHHAESAVVLPPPGPKVTH
jgi:serine/threonine protein kinase